MPIPGLTDIYAFSDWLKKEYHGSGRQPLMVEPINGGLINVTELFGNEELSTAKWRREHAE